MNLNYSIEGETHTITIITDRLPEAGERIHLPTNVVKRTWPKHHPDGFNPYFTVESVHTLDEDNFNITLKR